MAISKVGDSFVKCPTRINVTLQQGHSTDKKFPIEVPPLTHHALHPLEYPQGTVNILTNLGKQYHVLTINNVKVAT